jgi:hypothetical protein
MKTKKATTAENPPAGRGGVKQLPLANSAKLRALCHLERLKDGPENPERIPLPRVSRACVFAAPVPSTHQPVTISQ